MVRSSPDLTGVPLNIAASDESTGTGAEAVGGTNVVQATGDTHENEQNIASEHAEHNTHDDNDEQEEEEEEAVVNHHGMVRYSMRCTACGARHVAQ